MTPKSELTLTEAVDTLNRFELLDVRKNFDGLDLLDPSNVGDSAYALIYVFEKRKNPNYTVHDVNSLSIKELNSYFTDDAEVPGESDEGKD